MSDSHRLNVAAAGCVDPERVIEQAAPIQMVDIVESARAASQLR
jgi:hypothetical protein